MVLLHLDNTHLYVFHKKNRLKNIFFKIDNLSHDNLCLKKVRVKGRIFQYLTTFRKKKEEEKEKALYLKGHLKKEHIFSQPTI